MPIPEDYKDICQMLLEATNAKRVKWAEKGAAITVQFPEFSIEIWSGTDDRSERSFVGMALKDPKGQKLVDNWYVEEGDKDYAVLLTLWGSARRQARGVPEKLETLRQLLREGGDIGKDDAQS